MPFIISDLVLLVTFALCLFLLAALGIVFVYFKKEAARQERMLHISLIASMYSVIGVRSIKESSIIQKFVTQVIPSAEKDQEEIQEKFESFNEDFDNYLSMLSPRRPRPVSEKRESQEDFEIEETYDEELERERKKVRDLVKYGHL